jgi:hypothetical protein
MNFPTACRLNPSFDNLGSKQLIDVFEFFCREPETFFWQGVLTADFEDIIAYIKGV